MAIYILIISIVVFPILYWALKARHKQLEASSSAMDSFYKSAEALVNDDRTPEEVIDLAGTISTRLRTRKFVWKVFARLLTRKFDDPKVKGEVKKLFEVVFAMPPELQKHFHTMIISSVFIVSYNNFILGTVLRRVIMFGVELKARTQEQQESHRAEFLVSGMYSTSNLHNHAA